MRLAATGRDELTLHDFLAPPCPRARVDSAGRACSNAAVDEFALIDEFLACFPRVPAPRGPGDDCAVLPASREQSCLTTDAVVEGVHFTRRTFSLEDVGHKALAVNLSDLAAMGARPAWMLCALGLPARVPVAEVRALGRGMAALARQHRVELLGGNVTRAQELSVTLTLGGFIPAGRRPMLRSGGRPGDWLYVSGPLGDAAAGLDALGLKRALRRTQRERKAPEPLSPGEVDGRFFTSRTRGEAQGQRMDRSEHQRDGVAALMQAQRRPAAHVAFGLAAAPYASAAIDVSDGLVQDLGHVCERSRCGADLASEAVPLSSALLDYAGTRAAALRWALGGGEDYVLLLAVRPSRRAAFERALSRFAPTRVGRLTSGRGVRVDGRPFRGHRGFAHL